MRVGRQWSSCARWRVGKGGSSTARETRVRPSGYVAFIRDPDGHTLEVSCGQEVGLTIQHATEPHCGGRGMPRRCALFVRRQNIPPLAHNDLWVS